MLLCNSRLSVNRCPRLKSVQADTSHAPKIPILGIMNRNIALIVFLILNVSLHAQPKPNRYTDYHVHLQDSATVQLGYRMLKVWHQKPTHMDSLCFDADTIVGRLDRAKFHSAWIISNAYWFGSPATPVDNEYQQVKHQNDWIAQQAARYPDRLKAFMSVNPLKPYALDEIARCAATHRFAGLKLHFANSKVDLFDAVQVKQLQKVFAAANKYHLLMLVHFRSAEKWDGAANASVLVKQLLPFAKNTKVVIAHMAGWGGYDRQLDKALQVIASSLRSDAGLRHSLYLDISAVFPVATDSHANYRPAWHPLIAFKKRIAQIGTNHIVFGTDWPLIDIGPYIELLEKNLGVQTVRAILDTQVPNN